MDKTIKPPSGYGPVDHVFYRFQERWRDEWRRIMVSQAGCEALAGEWQRGLRQFDESAIRQAVIVAVSNCTMPPVLSSFVDMVEQVIAERRERNAPRNHELGRQKLNEIKALLNGEDRH